jgi:hypothetical protein
MNGNCALNLPCPFWYLNPEYRDKRMSLIHSYRGIVKNDNNGKNSSYNKKYPPRKVHFLPTDKLTDEKHEIFLSSELIIIFDKQCH